MIKNPNNGTDLKKHIDVDEWMRYTAGSAFLVNLDNYAGIMPYFPVDSTVYVLKFKRNSIEKIITGR